MILIPVGVFMVIVVVLGVIFAKRRNDDSHVATEQKEEQTLFREGLAERKNEILITDFSKGDRITVDYVLLELPGYVVVHDEVEGKPGNVIGSSSILFGGEAEDIGIGLKRETIPGEILFAILHKDNGDGEFNFPGDEPATDMNRNIIMSMFMVTKIEDDETVESTNSADTSP